MSEDPSELRAGPDDEDVTGSLARDHLANERTFLAWVRTALGFVGLGVIVAELIEVEGARARAAGVVFIAAGMAVAAYAMARFRGQRLRLSRGQFRPAEWGPLFVGGALLVVATGALVFVLD